MEEFYFFLCAMGLSQSMFFDGFNPNFDLISELPYEIATTILRCLDGKTLLTAALVCRKWWRLIKSDGVLRRKVRDELRARRVASLYFRPMENGMVDAMRRIFGRKKKGGEEAMREGKKRKFEKEISVDMDMNKKKKKKMVMKKGWMDKREEKGSVIFPERMKSLKIFR